MTIEEYHIPQLCEYAVSLCEELAATRLDGTINSLEGLEKVMAQVHELYQAGKLDEDITNKVVVCFGVYWGEIMLKDQLSKRGFSWKMNAQDLPVLMDVNEKKAISPISNIYKKIFEKEEDYDEDGTLVNCYRIYLWMLDHEEEQ